MRICVLSFLILILTALGRPQGNIPVTDQWGRIETSNFLFVGNIDPQKLTLVAECMERFRHGIRSAVGIKGEDHTKTHVLLFRNTAEFRPFKPKRANGSPDDLVRGSFRAGSDVNYIASTDDGKDIDSIYHEYVHDLIARHFDRDDVPSWLNEGLADYFQQFRFVNDRSAEFGLSDQEHLSILRRTERLPWNEFFSLDDVALLQSSDEKRIRFYAQAWALVSVLSHRQIITKTDSPRIDVAKLRQVAGAMSSAQLTTEIEKFVSAAVPPDHSLVIESKSSKVDAKWSALSEADTSAYLGDMAHRNRDLQTAEKFLAKALTGSPEHTYANATLGIMRTAQRRFAEAKTHLAKAIAGDSRNFLVYFYAAYLISREHTDPFGEIQQLHLVASSRMRTLLRRSSSLNPDHTESRKLFAIVSLIDGNELEDSLSSIRKAIELKPTDQEYRLIEAQLLLRLERLSDAKDAASKIVANSDDKYFRAEAQEIIEAVKDFQTAKIGAKSLGVSLNETTSDGPIFLKRKDVSDADVERIELERNINNLNRLIERPKQNEKQEVGRIERIVCNDAGGLSYRFRNDTVSLTLSGNSFDQLLVKVLLNGTHSFTFRCDTSFENVKAVVIYRPELGSRSGGTLASIAFVPEHFRLKTLDELSRERLIIIEGLKPSDLAANSKAVESERLEFERQMLETQLRNIDLRLREPQPGEKRILAIPEKFVCESGRYVLTATSDSLPNVFSTATVSKFRIESFTPETGLLEVACGMQLPAVPAVITYREVLNGKELIAVEFVPKIFKLR